jgi:two-component system capsular synthesis response regulator RcsB
MKIVLADDHSLVREALKILLQHHGHTVVGEVANAADIKHMVATTEPELLILDYAMPGGDTYSVACYLRKRYPQLRILILTGVQSVSILQTLLAADFHGVLLKQSNTVELLKAIQQIDTGNRYKSPQLTPYARVPDITLTARELQILNMIITGMPRHQIAAHLEVSAETIKSHRKNIMAKLQVNSVTQLYARAVELALV